MSKERSIATLPLDGGALCFHFINTVNAWRGYNAHEYLGSYTEVIEWCDKVDILDQAQRSALSEYAAQDEKATGIAMQKLLKAREVLYYFFSGIAENDGATLATGVLEKFNKALTSALAHLQFESSPAGMRAVLKQEYHDLLAPLWAVMKSAYDVLTTEEHSRIKECETCGWIFLDHTKNNKKRWCSPRSCGTADKSKRYYQRKKQQTDDI
ncbi:CGNR zinc finger domain-containing protein [Chitinophaga rhizophila]|uniref:CGNR zinc finger domain-containing protein n=1 Tax=Chitinophaga rhizophila TaxID=2866212 RepID=A0ABS7GIL1_9BACT|nr:CGNR zinc finger domain-containing protein [Chitinophaga rhizophila]MBW8687533.1 CGNR zinc finger domain-containing protein [Chitinophaga rhizophila]